MGFLRDDVVKILHPDHHWVAHLHCAFDTSTRGPKISDYCLRMSYHQSIICSDAKGCGTYI